MNVHSVIIPTIKSIQTKDRNKMLNVKKAAVLGAGTMGAAIAAHLSNAGIPTLLLDIAPKRIIARTRGERFAD